MDNDNDDVGARRRRNWNNRRLQHYHRKFQICCSQLQDNDPLLTSFIVNMDLNDDEAIRLGTSMIGNTHINTFLYRVEPGLSPRGVKGLVRGMSQLKLELLRLIISVRSNREVLRIIFQGIEQSKSIRELYIDNIQLVDADQLYQVLISSNSLRALTFYVPREWSMESAHHVATGIRRSRLTEIHVFAWEMDIFPIFQTILSGVERSQHIKIISLCQPFRSAVLEVEHMHLLGRVLSNNPAIKCLDLSRNQISNDAIDAFMESWDEGSRLEQLILRDVGMEVEAVSSLMRAIIASHPVMQKVDFYKNESIEYKGLALIGRELPNLQLRELDLHSCSHWIAYSDDEEEDHDDANREKIRAQSKARNDAGRALVDAFELIFTYTIWLFFAIDLTLV